MSKTILVVDDDDLLRQSISFNLTQAGYYIVTSASAEEALALAERTLPDLILLDIGLPGMDGLEALRHLRERCPVIFVTARRKDLDEILGLAMGADDYITKPFANEILLARVGAVLRRSQMKNPAWPVAMPLVVGDLCIDVAAHTVHVAGHLLVLTPLEFRLLHTLALKANQVIAVDDLIRWVWGDDYAGETQILYVYIRELRTKLEIDPHRPIRIVTVRGVGYKLVTQE
jgi:DNA-binding response OmpR family regulator